MPIATTALLLLTLGQDDFYQRQLDNQQYQNQQYRYEASQQAAQATFASKSALLRLQQQAQMDAVKAQAIAREQKKAPAECQTATVGTLKPLGGSFNERTNVLTVFLEEDDGSLWTLKAAFNGPERHFTTARRLAVESSSGGQFVSVMAKFVQTGHTGKGSAKRFKALFTDLTLHPAANVFEPAASAEGCLVIARVDIDVPWYD